MKKIKQNDSFAMPDSRPDINIEWQGFKFNFEGHEVTVTPYTGELGKPQEDDDNG